uniref:Uncharacterized protein n=1 Tax=Oryza meridionalis TaxID=40149 RepID=A0A0E0ELL2_9ORYZ
MSIALSSLQDSRRYFLPSSLDEMSRLSTSRARLPKLKLEPSLLHLRAFRQAQLELGYRARP